MNWLIRKLMYGEKLPRVIDPRSHEALDYMVTAYFLLLAGMFWGNHKRASASALINGMAVLGATLMTDYDGDGRRPISFPMHGKIDVAQMGMASGLPVLLGFANDWRSSLFQFQALSEAAVISTTDWEATGRGQAGKRAA